MTEKRHLPVVDTKDKEITQIGVVCLNAVQTAKQYAKVFGMGPWKFFDLDLKNTTSRNKPMADGASGIRVAAAHLGNLMIELLQPLYGNSTYANFLKTRGEGIHHLSFGDIDDADDFVNALNKHGVGVESSTVINGAVEATYLDTQAELAAVYKVTKPLISGGSENVKPWGQYTPSEPGIKNLKGKEIKQIGLVVRDVEKTAKAYWELFGIGPWAFMDGKIDAKGSFFHGVEYLPNTKAYLKLGFADLGPIQLELLEPVSGISTHMDFLTTKGLGIHHVGFRVLPDHDEVVEIMKDLGIGIEMTGVLGGALTFTYFESQKDLGTIFEISKIDPSIEYSMVPTGYYPPK